MQTPTSCTREAGEGRGGRVTQGARKTTARHKRARGESGDHGRPNTKWYVTHLRLRLLRIVPEVEFCFRLDLFTSCVKFGSACIYEGP